MRVLALVTDAFGGHGGIALNTSDLLTALSLHPSRPEILTVVLHPDEPSDPLPDRVSYAPGRQGGKRRFCVQAIRSSLLSRRFDLIFCNHAHLLPAAELARRRSRCPLVLGTYGVEAWTPHDRWSAAWMARVDTLLSIQRVTVERLQSWAPVGDTPAYVLENAIHLDRYAPAPKDPTLVERYGLEGRTVVLTLGRIEASEPDKGFDEMIEVLPELPEVTYLAVGGGDDIARLQRKADELGVGDRVVFTGRIAESAKADHYRLGDVFAMAGRGANFDRYPLRYVFLEAMACGVPVVAATPDAAAPDTVGLPIVFVDPFQPGSIVNGVRAALTLPRGQVAPALEHYAFTTYVRRLHEVIDGVLTRGRRADQVSERARRINASSRAAPRSSDSSRS